MYKPTEEEAFKMAKEHAEKYYMTHGSQEAYRAGFAHCLTYITSLQQAQPAEPLSEYIPVRTKEGMTLVNRTTQQGMSAGVWISVGDRLPDDDTPVTWKDDSGITFYADIGHDMGSKDLIRFLKNNGCPVRFWLDESPSPALQGWATDEDMLNAIHAGRYFNISSFKEWLKDYKASKK